MMRPSEQNRLNLKKRPFHRHFRVEGSRRSLKGSFQEKLFAMAVSAAISLLRVNGIARVVSSANRKRIPLSTSTPLAPMVQNRMNLPEKPIRLCDGRRSRMNGLRARAAPAFLLFPGCGRLPDDSPDKGHFLFRRRRGCNRLPTVTSIVLSPSLWLLPG